MQAFADAGNPALVHDFRSRLSTVLNLVAMHQANWPAVSIDQGRADYRRSAETVAQANNAFIEWARAALAHSR